VRGGRLRNLVHRLGLDRVHEVGELDRVLDEKHRDVVADEVVVALGRVELDREAADVAHRVRRAARADDRRKAREHRRLHGRVRKELRLRQVRHRLIHLKIAVRAEPARVHDALGDALVVEMRQLFPKVEVLHQRRPARARLQRVVGVRDGHALIGGQDRRVVRDPVPVQKFLFLLC